jgi:SAM-dependent methyltransferase
MSRRADRVASFHEADAALGSVLDELDESAPNYANWLTSMIEPALNGTVLELGAGRGTFTPRLLAKADRVVAVEPSAAAFAVLRERAAGDVRVVAVEGSLEAAADHFPFGGAVMVNVLEHIPDDAATLRAVYDALAPGARLAVYSPAFDLLYSEFDRAVGHFRRYRLPDLVKRFEEAGFTVVEHRYVNMAGWFAWLLVARLFHRRPTASSLTWIYDRVVVPRSRWVETHMRVPFGQSVLVIGQRPA